MFMVLKWLVFCTGGIFCDVYGPGMVDFRVGGISVLLSGLVKVKFQQGVFLLKCSCVVSDF